MSHTPEQARELWCPMSKFADKDIRVLQQSTCIANCCAMWQWIPSGKTYPKFTVVPLSGGAGRAGDAGGGGGAGRAGREEYVDTPVPPTHGYCGLAGRPEIAT